MSSQNEPNQNFLRILLYIEDNLMNALLVEQLISEHCNLKLLMAINGYQGIQIACSHQPDLILMDIKLPDIDGLEAMKILKENPETAHIPVIALSSNAYPKQIEEGLKAGFFRYLTKPFKINELMNAIVLGLNDTAENRPTPLPCR
jgi:CheY-like chemotaxis protein